jgi:hypothetical protein
MHVEHDKNGDDRNRNTFFAANANLSKQIYRAFYSNSVINKREYIEAKASFVESNFYNELIVNLEHYGQFYLHLGFQLAHDESGEYFYLKPTVELGDEEDEFDESSLKIMAVLTIVTRLATKRAQAISLLSEPVQGVSPSDLDALDEDEKTLNILKSLKLKSALDALDFLKKRGFAFKVGPERHVLSKGAMAMINTLLERQKALNDEGLSGQ